MDTDTSTDTEVRLATCPYCKTTKPSSPDLAFFEAGETKFDKCAVCRTARCLHRYNDKGVWAMTNEPHEFVLGVAMGDSFYCGCRGWD